VNNGKAKPARRRFRQESFIHSYFIRPAAQEIVLLIWNTNITPNQLTSFRILLNIVALCFFLVPDIVYLTLGGVLFLLHEIIDHADGMLARMKNMTSEVGAKNEIVFDTLFSTPYGFFGLCLAVSSFQLTGNYIYFIILHVSAFIFMCGYLFTKVASDKGEGDRKSNFHANHDNDAYTGLFTKGVSGFLKESMKTIYLWQNYILLLSAIALHKAVAYGYDTFLYVLILPLGSSLIYLGHSIKKLYVLRLN